MISIVAILIIIAAVVGSAFMTGALLTLWQRIRRLESGGAPPNSLDQASRQLDLLLEQMQSVADDMGELRERMDFTERLLVEGKTRGDADGTS